MAPDRFEGESSQASALLKSEEALRDETRVLELLNRIGRDLNSRLDLDAVLQAVTDAGTEIGEADFGVFIPGPAVPEKGAASGTGFGAARRAIVAAIACGGLAQDRTFHCDDLRHDHALRRQLMMSEEPDGLEGFPRSLIFIPLLSRDGLVLGAAVFGHRDPCAFTERTERILGGLAAQAAAAVDNARLYLQVTHEMNETRLLAGLQADSLLRMRGLSRRLIAAEELERKRLGRELHDRVGGNLSALLLCLDLMRGELPADATHLVARRLSDLEQTLKDTIEHVRDVMGNLRPTALDELGLVPALRHQAGVHSARSGVVFLVTGQELVPRMGPEQEMAFFRIAQEAWANALKHSDARSVELAIGQHGGLVRMRIADDGIGFDLEARPAGSPSLGLTIMRERAEAIGAVLHVESSVGSGVRVAVELLREAAAVGAAQ